MAGRPTSAGHDRAPHRRGPWRTVGERLARGPYDEGAGAADFDGDGKDDFYTLTAYPANIALNVVMSTGTRFADGYTSPGRFYQPLTRSWCAADSMTFADVNGDGRTDLLCTAVGRVALSTGRTFPNPGLTVPALSCYGGAVFGADLDGDGASEIVCNASGAGASDIRAWRWQNNTFQPVTWSLDSYCGDRVVPADYNGDGKTDLACAPGYTMAVAGTAAFRSDLMGTVANGLGGSFTVSYTPAPKFVNENSPGAFYAVSSSSENDGRGTVAVRGYSYSGGKSDRLERRFLGFRTMVTTHPALPGESTDPRTVTYLKQDLANAGSPENIYEQDGAGHNLRLRGFVYTTNGAVPRVSNLTGEFTIDYSSFGSDKRTQTTYTYDAYGNRIQTYNYGDLAASGDEVVNYFTYTVNTTAYITSRLAQRTTKLPLGTQLASQLFYYDNATSATTPPTKGLLTQSLNWLNTDGRWIPTTYTYDNWGNQTSVKDPTNRTVTTTFDTSKHIFPTSTTNATNETASQVWDPICGVPSQQTSVNNQVTTLEYDALCRPTRTDTPLGGFKTYSYLYLGSPTSQRVRVEFPSAVPGDSSGNDYAVQYFDGFSRGYKTLKKGPAVGQDINVTTAYNVRGGVDSTTAPYHTGATTQTATIDYDVLNRPVRTTFPDGNFTETSYELWSTTTRDELGHPTTTTVDGYGRVVLKTQELNGAPVETTSTYDLLGRLVGMTDHLGNQWSWTYDSLGRLREKNDADAGVTTYTYDDAGRVLTQTDAKGQPTTFTYDSVGRLASKTYRGSNGGGTTETVTFTRSEARAGFFNKGEVTTITAPLTTLTTNYDALGRAINQARVIDGTAQGGSVYTYTIENRIDAMGRLLGTTYPDGDVVGSTASPLTYDSAGRLKGIPGIVNGVTYDAAGRPLVLTNANGTTSTRTYTTERGFLTQIQTQAGSTQVQSQSYTNDASGKVTQVISPFANETWTYDYDDLNRLTSATSSVNPTNNQTFQYDEIGRITFNSKVGNYTYPSIGGPRPHAPTSGGSNTYIYDSNGNMTAGAGRTMTWNGDNRITSVVKGGTTHQYLYDGLGERLVQLAGSTASFYPFGDDYEVKGTTVTKYISAPGLGVIAKRVGTTTYWMHTDRLGSIESITTSTGAVALRRTYTPYGNKIADTGTHTESRGWIDQRQDMTGLTYLHARYYDSAMGAFISPDPLDPWKEGVGLHRYGYASGNPANLTDRTGLLELDPQPNYTDMLILNGGSPRRVSLLTTIMLRDLSEGRTEDADFMMDMAQSEARRNPDYEAGAADLMSLYALYDDATATYRHDSAVADARARQGSVTTEESYDLSHIPTQEEIDAMRAVEAQQGQDRLLAVARALAEMNLQNSILTNMGLFAASGVGAGAAYAAGTSATAGLAWKFAPHGPHHRFGPLGNLPHLQWNWWRDGVKGSDRAFRIPFPRSWWDWWKR